MILPDNKPDSILVYTDWLIDNNQEELALEIRKEAGISDWFYEHKNYSQIFDFIGNTIQNEVGGVHFLDTVGTETNGVADVGGAFSHNLIGG